MSDEVFIDVLAGRGCIAIKTSSQRFMFVSPESPLPRSYIRPTMAEYASWKWAALQVQEERLREIADVMAEEEREYAARRRAEGLPPAAPIHPELVEELQAEYDACCEARA